MVGSLWAFIKDPHNQAVLSWIGGGIAVVIGGLWASFKFFFASKEKPKAEAGTTVSASNGGVAAGRDIRNSKINARGGSKR